MPHPSISFAEPPGLRLDRRKHLVRSGISGRRVRHAHTDAPEGPISMFLPPMCINCVFVTVTIVMCGSVIAAMSIYSLSLELVASIVLGALVFNLSFLACTACMRLLYHRFDEWSRRIQLYHQDVCHWIYWIVKENWRLLALSCKCFCSSKICTCLQI